MAPDIFRERVFPHRYFRRPMRAAAVFYEWEFIFCFFARKASDASRRLPSEKEERKAAFVFYGAVRGFFGWDRRPADMPAGSSGRGKRPQRRQRGVVSHRKGRCFPPEKSHSIFYKYTISI